MSTFGDIERTFADLYPYRWAIGAVVLVLIAGVFAFGFWKEWHLAIWRHRLLVGAIAVPILAVNIRLGWSLGSPLFTNVTVEEEFPLSFTAVVPPNMEHAEVEEIMAGSAKLSIEESEAMPTGADMARTAGMSGLSASGQAMLREGLAMVSGGAEDENPELLAKGVDMMNQALSSDVDKLQVVRLRTGVFKDADAFHRGKGQATIYSGPGGSYLLRLEELDVTNGPALHVYLSTHGDPTRSEEVKAPGFLDLGKLKGNRGNQNYPIPADADISTFNSVVIYCKPFAVVFSVATLRDST